MNPRLWMVLFVMGTICWGIALIAPTLNAIAIFSILREAGAGTEDSRVFLGPGSPAAANFASGMVAQRLFQMGALVAPAAAAVTISAFRRCTLPASPLLPMAGCVALWLAALLTTLCASGATLMVQSAVAPWRSAIRAQDAAGAEAAAQELASIHATAEWCQGPALLGWLCATVAGAATLATSVDRPLRIADSESRP